jgi:hypothetical protein
MLLNLSGFKAGMSVVMNEELKITCVNVLITINQRKLGSIRNVHENPIKAAEREHMQKSYVMSLRLLFLFCPNLCGRSSNVMGKLTCCVFQQGKEKGGRNRERETEKTIK